MKIKIIDAEVRLVHPQAKKTNYAKNNKELRVHEIIYKRINHKKKINHLWSVDVLLNSMKKNQISCAFLGTLYWKSIKLHRLNNEYNHKVALQNPNKFYIFQSLHYLEVKKWQKFSSKKINKLLDNFKKKKYFLGFDFEPHSIKMNSLNWKLESWDKFFKHIEKKKISIRIVGRHPHQHKLNYPYFFLSLFKKYPKINFYITAMGGSISYYEELSALKKVLKNVHYILSTPTTPSMIKTIINLVPDKVMFGTDFPFNHSFNQQFLVKKIKTMNLKKNIYRKIMYQNSKKLLTID